MNSCNSVIFLATTITCSLSTLNFKYLSHFVITIVALCNKKAVALCNKLEIDGPSNKSYYTSFN